MDCHRSLSQCRTRPRGGLPVTAVIYSHSHGDHWGGVRGVVDEEDVRAGKVEIIAPTRFIEDDIEEIEVDGVKMVFQNTLGTEAPSNMNTWMPEMKALWMAENVTATLHHIYTLRGAPVRNPLRWSKHIARAMHSFAKDADVMFYSHHWPRCGNDRIMQILRDQRDLYAHMSAASREYRRDDQPNPQHL